jgi:hypothetical protein
MKPIDIPLVHVNADEVRERCRTDINFFGSLAIPTVMLSPFPAFYVAIFQMLINRKPEQIGRILRFALGLPRGHAKTTFIKVILAWLIVFDKIRFVVVVCASESLALEIVDDINDILGSDNIEQVFGKWTQQLTTDSKELKKAFYHGRNVTIAAKGEGSSMRGINIKHERPDCILFDDAQTKECDESPVESLKFRRRFVATLKIIAPRGDRLIVYIGNMYSESCMLYQLKTNTKWISLITGAILEDGTPLWPELHSLEELLDSFLHDSELGEEDVWFAEVMNDPIVVSLSLLSNPIPEYRETFDQVMPDGVFITIDPAGMKDTSDDNVIVLHYVYDGKGIVRRINAGVKDPETLIKEALILAMDEGASLIGIEDAGYQSTLMFWMNKYMEAWGVKNIMVVPLKPKNRSKESRIRAFVFEVVSGEYKIHAEARAMWIWQAMKYKIGKKDNKDDILDGAAYGIDVRAEYWPYITNLKKLSLTHQRHPVLENNTPF